MSLPKRPQKRGGSRLNPSPHAARAFFSRHAVGRPERTLTPPPVLLASTRQKRVTTFAKNLLGGGAERAAVRLLAGLPRDRFEQDLVLVDAWGPFLEHVPLDVPLFNLGLGDRVHRAILPLARHLRQHQPDVLISHLAHANVAAVMARELARVRTKVVLVEHNDNSVLEAERQRSAASRVMKRLKAAAYRRADVIIGVSQGVAHYVETSFGLPAGQVIVLPNAVVDDALLEQAHAPLEHPWFVPGAPPVFVASGRLRPQKDFFTLLRAFDLVRRARPCNLLILGEGQERGALEAEVSALGLEDNVLMPGFVENPFAYMSRAGAFVLSSRWEGLPTVLIEAMACGCPVVATDCPSGPAEIMEGGRWGPLVEVGDAQALADAMLGVLDTPPERDGLRARAAAFSNPTVMRAYADLFESL